MEGAGQGLSRDPPATRLCRKTADVLDKLPKRLPPQAEAKLHDVRQADTRAHAFEEFESFLATYESEYPSAADCLRKDRDVLFAFYGFPAEHRLHLRATKPIKSPFVTVRLRHRRTKGNGSRRACLAMVFKMTESAVRHRRLLDGAELLPDVIVGVVFQDGVRAQVAAA